MSLDVVYYTLYAISIVGIFIVSALVYLRGNESEHRYFAFFATLLNVWLALQFFAQLFADNQAIDTLLLRITTGVGPFFALYFFFFAAQYGGKKIKKWPHFVLPCIAAVICIATDLVVHEASASFEGIALEDGTLYYAVAAIVVGYVLAGLGLIFKDIRKKHVLSPARKQAGILFIAAVLQALVIVSFAAVFFASETISQVLIPFSLFLMVIIFGYAIVRHRLFDIRLVAIRALTYSLSLATLAGLYSILAFLLVRALLGVQEDFIVQALYLAIALVLALTFAPLKSFFDRITRSVFYQDAYEPQKVIDNLSSVLVSTVNIEDLSRNAAEVLRGALKSQYISILLFPRQTPKGNEHFTVGEAGKFGEDLIPALSRHEEKMVLQDELHQKNGKLARELRNANCAVAVRLEAHSDFIGYILFGIKNNGRPYTQRDIDLIHTIADELALGVQNALRFDEISKFNVTLQQRIDDATKELRRTNEQLKKLDTAKDEFVSMASHQLRTPLTSVKGYISMVLEGDVGKITPMQRQLLGEAFTSSERMVHLIGDFLNVSRLQTGKFLLEKRPIDLSKLVSQEIDSLHSTVEAHGLKLEYHKPSHFPILMLDEGKVRQVLMNFIDNAIFYSQEGKTITVRLGLEAGYAVLRVIDEGIGVPKSEQAHLFAKFFRASNARKQRPDGTGVGLFLAKKVVVAHGGTIVFESKEGEGSTFGFRLPVKKLQPSEEEIHDSAGNRTNKLNQ